MNPSVVRIFRHLSAGILLCGMLVVSVEARSKLDIVHLNNGDRITGEITNLERGILNLDTDSAGTLQINWLDITSVASPQLFEIETRFGSRYFGTIETVQGEEALMVVGGQTDLALKFSSVVRIEQFDEGFMDRLSFVAEGGYSFAKANSQSQLTLAAGAEYRTRNYLGGINYDAQVNNRSDTARNVRNNLSLSVNRYFRQQWFATLLSSFQQNDELSLELRTLYGGGLGRGVYRSNYLTFDVTAGGAYTREKFFEKDTQSNGEAMIGSRFSAFRHSSPELLLTVDFKSYPNLTTLGRIRLELETRFRYEIIRDLFFGLGFYNNFDSKPPSEFAERNDFGIRTTIGWTFN